MHGLGKRKLSNATVADTAPARERSVNERNAGDFVAIHSCAKARMEEGVLVIIARA
jgi:hypothetical protein